MEASQNSLQRANSDVRMSAEVYPFPSKHPMQGPESLPAPVHSQAAPSRTFKGPVLITSTLILNAAILRRCERVIVATHLALLTL